MSIATGTAPEPGDALDAGRRTTCAVLLRDLFGDPRALLTALDGDGFRAPWPVSVNVPAGRLMPLSPERSTMLNLVAPPDRMPVVAAWERAVADGHAAVEVHPVDEPHRPLMLNLVDARSSHGLWVGALTETEPVNDGSAGPPPGSLAVRPGTRSGTLHKNARGIITGIDDRATRMLGWTAADLVGARSTVFIHRDDVDRVVNTWLEMLGGGQSQRVRFRHRCAGGSWLWVEAENTVIATGAGAEAGAEAGLRVTSLLSDISEEMAAHEAVASRERLFRRLTEALPVGVLRVESDQTIAYANPAVDSIIGRLPEATSDTLLGLVADTDRPTLSGALSAALDTGMDGQVEISLHPLGTTTTRRCTVSLIALTDEHGESGALACIQDITDSARARDVLTIRATMDPLTGCHNRASVLAALEHALVTTPPGSTAVVFIDLDHFKPVNDELGHAVGDELLVHVAAVLATISRPHDLVGRIGGDEFLLVLTDIGGSTAAFRVAERAAKALHQPVSLSGHTVNLGASIGVACSRPADTAKSLTARADVAMYASKSERAGRPHLESEDDVPIDGADRPVR